MKFEGTHVGILWRSWQIFNDEPAHAAQAAGVGNALHEIATGGARAPQRAHPESGIVSASGTTLERLRRCRKSGRYLGYKRRAENSAERSQRPRWRVRRSCRFGFFVSSNFPRSGKSLNSIFRRALVI